MSRFIPALAAGALAFGSTAAHAQAVSVVIDIDPAAARQAGISDTAALESELRGQLDSTLVLDDQSSYMQQMADANVLSAKGLGVDYASNFEKFILGGGFGSAVNSGGFRFGSGDGALPSSAFAFQATVMAGVNLGFGTDNKKSFAKRIRLYGHGLVASTSRDPFAGDLLNYGGHAQFKIVRPSGKKGSIVRFSGVDLTSGYEVSRYTLALEQGLPAPSGDTTWDATGAYTISAQSTSVPVEVSTGLKIAVISAYVGGAADINLEALADSEIGMTGALQAENPSTGQQFDIGTAGVTATASGEGAALTPRVFGGLMAHVLFVKLYGHLNVSFDRSVGGHLGARVAF